MSRLLHIMYEDLALYVIGAGGFLFILALIASAWRERRQARLLREQAKGKLFAICRTTPLQAFLKKFRGRLLLLGMLVMVAIVVVMLSRTKEKPADTRQNSSDAGSMSAYPTNSQADESFATSAAEQSLSGLWSESVLSARTLNLNSGTNLSEKQKSTTPADESVLIFQPQRPRDKTNQAGQ